MRYASRLPTFGIAILTVFCGAAAAPALDAFYLTRHADKAEFWPRALDAFRPLSRAGHDRAERLAERLRDAGIKAIYTSATTRTLATGMPLAEATGKPIGPDERSTEEGRMEAFLEDLKGRHPGDGAAWIVGHSDTVPLLLEKLGAAESCFARLGIEDHGGTLLVDGYEGLWRVDLSRPGCAGIERLVVSLEPAAGDG